MAIVLFAATAAGVTVLALLARHERHLVKSRRRLMLDGIEPLFSSASLTADGAGIPRIEGVYQRRRLTIDLIPDTMTIRRLPQLWVSVTALAPLPLQNKGIAVLVRPSGADFYSLTEHMEERFDPSASFPWECLVRGQTDAARATLDRVSPAVTAILADPKVKEIGVTSRGLRIVYQLAEGKRGQHLLLRQCDFEGARLKPELLERLCRDLDTLAASLGIDLTAGTP
jgi:hypothetical protein